MTANLHLIKSLYVPESKRPSILIFEELCKRRNMKFSQGVIELIEFAIATPHVHSATRGQKFALEDYLTSEKEARKRRIKRADEEWIFYKKGKGL